MKKTLITLLALAGVAAAAEQTITLSDYAYTDGFYATTVLSLEQLTTIMNTSHVDTTIMGVGVLLDNNSTHSAAVALKTWNNDAHNQFHVYYNQGAGVDASSFGNANASFTAPSGYTWPTNHGINDTATGGLTTTNAVGAALTFAFAPKNAATDVYGISVALTIAYTDGTYGTIVGNADKYSWSNNSYKATEFVYDDTYLSAPTVTKSGTWTHADLVNANMTALVPEPTTATLSLLALAGLAARRRRK